MPEFVIIPKDSKGSLQERPHSYLHLQERVKQWEENVALFSQVREPLKKGSRPFHSLIHSRSPWKFRGIPWISIDFHGIPWTSIDFHGFPWISMEVFHTGNNYFGFGLTTQWLLKTIPLSYYVTVTLILVLKQSNCSWQCSKGKGWIQYDTVYVKEKMNNRSLLILHRNDSIKFPTVALVFEIVVELQGGIWRFYLMSATLVVYFETKE